MIATVPRIKPNPTKRWTPLRYHPVQQQVIQSPCRFIVVPAGRRSGKTEIAKRIGVHLAMTCLRPEGLFVFSAPTHAQAKRLYWDDVKKLVPNFYKLSTNESSMSIRLRNGATILVIGLDKAMRLEGVPIDWIVIDEIANAKPDVWESNIRPTLDTIGRPGYAMLIGVPEGRNHYWEIDCRAKEDKTGAWASFSWPSSDILPAHVIADARRDLDKLTFQQEYMALFVNFSGLAYYGFNRDVHAAGRVMWKEEYPSICLCFDFNVEPGIALVAQDQEGPTWLDGRPMDGSLTTCFIDEIHIERNSNTVLVCRELLERWGWFEGDVFVYGDPSGGQRRSSATEGTDWDIVNNALTPVFGKRLKWRVSDAAPAERSRTNAFNSRLESYSGRRAVAIDPIKCPNLIRDLEGVTRGDGGEIDKKDKKLTHHTDAAGYMFERRFPVREGSTVTTEDF